MTEPGGTSSGTSGADDIGVRIVREVAAELDRSPMELEPLAGLVDIDALSSLTTTQSVNVSFEYEGLRVTVHRDGSVGVERLDDRSMR
ncbi:HalOD1 output domain-containing protein [Halopelagius longus]|uniref:Halobacterial output domain-containing protein n=1 Tax=Halopelagius longus TaxID=1236180 RepID=A0A1H1DTD2_9EURY|nr:HalOD1 output domain-containing protein [Halopelagius longus]RDI71462.1 hypothetical protein DWB78_06855 [Halopelagius longus]SDQ79734.1 hypothetical protein SAMN05216278_2572 [Halopelagius longus]